MAKAAEVLRQQEQVEKLRGQLQAAATKQTSQQQQQQLHARLKKRVGRLEAALSNEREQRQQVEEELASALLELEHGGADSEGGERTRWTGTGARMRLMQQVRECCTAAVQGRMCA